MTKRKSLITVTISVALIFASCGRIDNAQTAGDGNVTPAPAATDGTPSAAPTPEGSAATPATEESSRPASEEPSPTPEPQPEDGTDVVNIDNNISAFTNLSYRITEESYEQGGINIKYPCITGLKDADNEEKINGLIKNDAMKFAKDYNSDGAALDVSFQIAWAGDMLLSVKFIVYSNMPEAAHPNHTFYTTNIYVPMASKIRLEDMVKISDYFARAFVGNSKYIAPFKSGDPNLDSALQGYMESIDGAYLRKADGEDQNNECFSYFTGDSLGIGIGVPFAIGGYALYEIKYEDIISYIENKNEMWKDFPGILAKIQTAGNDSITGNAYELIPEGWTVLQPLGGYKAINEGDFDKDGNTDLVFVIEGAPESEGKSAPRTLMVAFGNGDWTYTLAVEAKNAILKADEGGIWGEPFEGIEIKNGSIYLHFYGGSSWRWDNTYQFRFQDGDFYLIGARESFINISTNEGTVKDYNLLTGDYTIKETAADGKTAETKGNYDKRYKYELTDFNPRDAGVFDF